MNSDNIPDLAAILPKLKQWHTDHHEELAAAGVTATLRESPPEWNKASISIELESGPRGSRLTVWDSGETEHDLVDIDSGVHIPQHQVIATAADADKLLSQQLTWVDIHQRLHNVPGLDY